MKYKATQKDRYGNMKSLEITMDNQLEVPPMTSAVPMYDHPGEPKGTDTVPAWLTPGEFVVNKEATDMYGPLIKKINDEGRKIQNMKPEYAEVGMPVPKPNKDVIAGEKFKNKRSRQSDIYNYLKENYPQLTDDAIAGIMGNIGVETGYTYEYTTRQNENTGDRIGPGMGLFQFDEQKKPYLNYLKANDKKDSMASQLDYFVQSIYNKDAVPHPTNKSGFRIGKTNAENLQKSFANNDAETIALDVMNKHLKPGVPHADRRVNKAKEIKELIDNKAFGDPSVYDKYREAGIQVPPSSDGLSFDIPNPLSSIKEKASSLAKTVKDFVDPNNIGLPTLKFSSNKFEMPKRSGIFDRKSDGGKVQHLDPGGIVYPTLDDQDDIMKLIFESEKLSDKTDDILSSVKVPEDDTTTMSMDMSLPSDNYVESYDPQGLGMPMADPTYMSSYDKMVQDELSGSPAYEIPPVFQQIDPDMYDQETGDKLLKVDKPVSMGVTKPNMLQMEGDILSNLMLPTDVGIAAQIAEKQQMLDNEMKNLTIYRDVKPNPKMLETSRKIVNKLENQIKDLKKTQALQEFRATSDFVPNVEAAKEEIQKEANKAALEQVISSDETTETEKTVASQALSDLNNQEDTTEVITPLEESQSKLVSVANNLNTAKEAELNQDLNSDAGKAAQNDANQSQGTPAYEQAKGVLNFLFGDLIDGQELGRGIAIYLASRALGYDHNDTIGYVAKNYLKRVDTKNALMDKFIKENAGKYTKKSLADYKRTGDPNMLTPIGSTPRPQGEEKTYYNAAGQARVAYKFKKKNAQGDDFTYWSWDKDGGDVKQRVSSAWTSDGSDVQGTDEYNEKINKAADRIVGQMKAFKEGKDKTKEKNIDKGIMQNVYKTDIEPEFAAREVAAWADKNGFEVYEMGSGIQQAWNMAIAAADEAEAQGIDVSITSLLPYLEEATIKQRLDNLKGVPPVSTAIVNGNKIEMNPSELVILNGKINNVTGDVNRFWNTVAKVYKGNDKESGKPWKKIFEQHVIDSGENITPFALFGQVYLENIMEGMANQ